MDLHSSINQPILGSITILTKLNWQCWVWVLFETSRNKVTFCCSKLGRSYKERLALFFFFFCWGKRIALWLQCWETSLLELPTIECIANGSWKPGSVCSQYFRIPPRVVLYRHLVAFWHICRNEYEERLVLLLLFKWRLDFEPVRESDTSLSWCFHSYFSCVHLPAHTPTSICSPS